MVIGTGHIILFSIRMFKRGSKILKVMVIQLRHSMCNFNKPWGHVYKAICLSKFRSAITIHVTLELFNKIKYSNCYIWIFKDISMMTSCRSN